MPKQILFADDNVEMQNLVKTYLERKGYSVTTVSDGWAALASVKVNRPDLILLDVSMPKMDGIRTIEMLIGFDLLRGVPIILLTGSASKEVVLKAVQLGVADYLVKPFDVKDLAARISKQIVDFQFGEIQQILLLLREPAKDRSPFAQVAELAEGKWNPFPITIEGRELCILVDKEVPQLSLKSLSESRATSVARIYMKSGALWRKVWPLHEGKPAQAASF